MHDFFWPVLVLFWIKIGWNMLTPYVLAAPLFNTAATKIKRISMVPAVEICLWLAAINVSGYVVGASWWHRPDYVAFGGAAVIAASYIHLVLARWVLEKGVAGCKRFN